MNRYWRNFTQL